MKEFIEKLIGRLKEEKQSNLKLQIAAENEYNTQYFNGKRNALAETIEIVNELAEEYKHCTLCYLQSPCEYQNENAILPNELLADNNGWIPCNERLPKDDSICIVTVEYPNNETVVDYGWFDRVGVCWYVGMQEFRTSNILAWQPLPEPYKEGGTV